MNAKEALRSAMDMSLFVLNSYVGDLSDEDLLRRPTPGCNHLAWQLGHLISSEVMLLNAICPGKGGDLPEGFAEKHAKDTCDSDDASQFCSRQEYVDAYQTVRAATLQALEEIPESDLDNPAPEFLRENFPSVGHVFMLIGNHPLMHAGQFVVVRRQLDKPILI